MIGGTSAALLGSSSAAPLDLLPIATPANTTYVLPDLIPFEDNGSKGAGKGEVSDEYGAPAGGGKAAFRLSTPTGDDKASYAAPAQGAETDLANWIATGAYSAYQGAADTAFQFPSLQLIVDFNGAETGGFATLFYEPVYNAGASTAPDQWNRYQAGAGRWCSTKVIPGVLADNQAFCANGGDKPLTDYVTGAPDLVVQGVAINQGSGNSGLESAVDLITTPRTTYDFELTKPTTPVDPTTPPTTPPTTEPGNGGGNNGGNNGHPGNNHGNNGHPGNNGGGNSGGHGNNGGDCVCG
ncbi:hypothetical protein [Actinomycetospora sp. CA-084318]|uniref:hypothetical protein n=1 Tax=Actinomycetospora sp. CA-084318 TaxID=3239892 RepID=UPI003D9715C8